MPYSNLQLLGLPPLSIPKSVYSSTSESGVFESCCQLLFIANLAQPFGLSGCQIEIYLNTNQVQKQTDPKLFQVKTSFSILEWVNLQQHQKGCFHPLLRSPETAKYGQPLPRLFHQQSHWESSTVDTFSPIFQRFQTACR